ncbi:MAG: FABP family protein [Fimbriimonadaceae bacterium]|nr:FABP family protein [Fimbriimonadaceae bacterium]QYK54936.1 MAG: FABP family protein [Fimbriimonadaceae bacterium]
MKSTLRLLTVAALATASFVARAQDFEPPAELKKLDWMIGSWSGSGKMAMQGMEMDFTAKVACSWEGQFMKLVSETDFGMLKMTETMFLGWSPTDSQYIAYSFTNISPEARIETGSLEGDTMTMVSQPWNVMGDSSVARTKVGKKSATKLLFKLEFKEGDDWVPASEYEMTKG